MSAESDDDVPPLEDMSEELEQRKEALLFKQTNSVDKKEERREFLEVSPKLLEEKLLVNPKARNSSSSSNDPVPMAPKKPSNFGGMAKGFLLGGAEQKKIKKTKEPTVPLIKAKQVATSKVPETFLLPEAKEALKAFSQKLDKDKGGWITDDLQQKILANPILRKKFSDPHFIAEFSKNPASAASSTDAENQAFMKEFCGLMGNHFEELAKEKEGSGVATASADVDKDVQEILANDETKQALMDPKIQTLMQLLKQNPTKAQKLLKEKSSDQVFRRHLQRLIDAGLLSIAT